MKKERAPVQTSPSQKQTLTRDNSSGTTSVTFGILGVILSLISPIPGIILGTIALIFGLAQRKAYPSRWSSVGITLGIIAILVGLLGIIITLMFTPDVLGGLE